MTRGKQRRGPGLLQRLVRRPHVTRRGLARTAVPTTTTDLGPLVLAAAGCPPNSIAKGQRVRAYIGTWRGSKGIQFLFLASWSGQSG
jgi:hypothetical protein